eukprot:9013507-Pyramimonas_sp.AAC.1
MTQTVPEPPAGPNLRELLAGDRCPGAAEIENAIRRDREYFEQQGQPTEDPAPAKDTDGFSPID